MGTTALSATGGIDRSVLGYFGSGEVGSTEMERDVFSNALHMAQGDVSDLALWIQSLVIYLPV